jgi:hypothetical protein
MNYFINETFKREKLLNRKRNTNVYDLMSKNACEGNLELNDNLEVMINNKCYITNSSEPPFTDRNNKFKTQYKSDIYSCTIGTENYVFLELIEHMRLRKVLPFEEMYKWFALGEYYLKLTHVINSVGYVYHYKLEHIFCNNNLTLSSNDNIQDVSLVFNTFAKNECEGNSTLNNNVKVKIGPNCYKTVEFDSLPKSNYIKRITSKHYGCSVGSKNYVETTLTEQCHQTSDKGCRAKGIYFLDLKNVEDGVEGHRYYHLERINC